METAKIRIKLRTTKQTTEATYKQMRRVLPRMRDTMEYQ
jgi:hypothetical protein